MLPFPVKNYPFKILSEQRLVVLLSKLKPLLNCPQDVILKRLESLELKLESENQEIKRGQSSITLAIGEVTNKLGTLDEKIGTLDGQVSFLGKILLPPFHKKMSLVRIWPYLKFPIYY